MDILELHSDKVSPEPISGCWLWTACTNEAGYGIVWFQKKTWRANRLSYTLSCEEIPEGLHVLHKCDIPTCVNPDHLFLGTNDENIADRNAKGRQSRGGKNGRSVLTENQVLEIRALREGKPRRIHGEFSQESLAKRYGVDRRTISDILKKNSWAYLGNGAESGTD